jgi:hypothetical protein
MCLLRRATRDDPDQWGPGLCSTSFELADDESIPTDEDGFCSYLDQRDSQWQLVDTSDYRPDMIGFSLEFKRWYVVVRGPKGTVYLAFGFAKQMPVFTPAKTMTLQECIDDYNDAIVFTDEKGEELMRI